MVKVTSHEILSRRGEEGEDGGKLEWKVWRIISYLLLQCYRRNTMTFRTVEMLLSTD